ncbi:low molecular weight protein-tyrosine-phosphatase [Paraburkholderia phenoliruptrix]|uniref:protein-tyrosine-phosphatase n=2 Tax=Paraburkholderia phenoliruptrix TaxID=252970 RepID=K0E2W4_9BURK|nr:low molecular weight protein-tyrosine-phosphatase [Paraburkholderia phenoliruptrix]AFT90119.1 low molecular weight protein-tyrosine-phosphatase [Paraburkholderia phenoliruptrix BR3459a]CAB4052755.1 Low molecular weight protein-tyrosine-phosphatase Ptp [Paraburkholderia phenoliruptrix]
MIRSILTVCIGNICRSPMAAGLLHARLPKYQILSAGLGALSGMPPDRLARELMHERGIDIDAHRAIQLGALHCSSADMILVMDGEQKRMIEERYRLTRGKVFRLGNFQDRDIFDPYGGTRADFERCLELISLGVDEWVERIKLTA